MPTRTLTNIKREGRQYEVDAQSVLTDQLNTAARDSTYVVHKSSGNIKVDGPSSEVYSGTSWKAAVEAAVADASLGDSIKFNGAFDVDATPTVDTIVQLLGSFARLTVADGANATCFKIDVDGTGNPFRRPIKVSGFDADGNKANNTSSTFLEAVGDATNTEISGNTIRQFAGGSTNNASGIDLTAQGAGQVYHIINNNFTGLETWGVYSKVGWSWIVGNDLGGGVRTLNQGANFILGNSIFDSKMGAGVIPSRRDIVGLNFVIDNDEHGIDVSDGKNIAIRGNTVANNGVSNDNNFDGIVVAGFGGAEPTDITVVGNRCYNRTPNGGSGNGLQRHGIRIAGDVDGCYVAASNDVRGNETSGLFVNDSNITNCRIEDPVGSGRTAGSTRPTAPYQGMPFFDTSIGLPIEYDGSNWVTAVGESSAEPLAIIPSYEDRSIDFTKTSYDSAGVPNTFQVSLDWDETFGDNVTPMVKYTCFVNPGTDETVDTRLQNDTDDETVAEITGLTGGASPRSSGWVEYTPTTTSSPIDIKGDHKTSPGSDTSFVDAKTLHLGLKVS